MVDVKKLLTTALGEIEAEEQAASLEARFKALEDRKPNMRLGDLLQDATDDELEALADTVLARQADAEADRRDAEADDPDAGDDPPPRSRRRTRPGRKSGEAYDWDVDDDGNVVRSSTAVIYSGEDEPDDVELPAAAGASE